MPSKQPAEHMAKRGPGTPVWMVVRMVVGGFVGAMIVANYMRMIVVTLFGMAVFVVRMVAQEPLRDLPL